MVVAGQPAPHGTPEAGMLHMENDNRTDLPKVAETPAARKEEQPAIAGSADLASGTRDDPVADMQTRHLTGVREQSSILAAVEGLSSFNKEMKDRLKSPSRRKSGPPCVKKHHERKVAAIDGVTKVEPPDLEVVNAEANDLQEQLQQARDVAAAATAAADAAAAAAAAAIATAPSPASKEDGRRSSSGRRAQSLDGDRRNTPRKQQQQQQRQQQHAPSDEVALELQRQAEERVRARRRQEAHERRDKLQREAEENEARQVEAETKAKELERQAKERVQQRLREQRTLEQEKQTAEEQAFREKEERDARVAEELQQQALRRVSNNNREELRRQIELEQSETEGRQWTQEKNEAQVAELQEKTRLRMRQHARVLREQQDLEARAEQCRREEEAEAAETLKQQALLGQQRAKHRAAEFRQRTRNEDQERARSDEETQARQTEQAQAEKQERLRRRNWRIAEPTAQHMEATPSSSSQGPTPRAKLRQPHMVPAPFAKDTKGVSGPAEGSKTNDQKPSVTGAGPLRHSAGDAGGHSKPSGAAAARRYRGSGIRRRQFDRQHEVTVPRPMEDKSHILHNEASATEDGVVRFTVDFFGMGAAGVGDGSDDEKPDDDDDDDEGEEEPAEALLPQPVLVQPRSAAFARGSRPPPPLNQQGPPCPQARAGSQPPSFRSPTERRFADAAVIDQRPADAGSHCRDPCVARVPKRAPWKQKAIEVPSTDYYLDVLKAARSGNASGGPGKLGESPHAGDSVASRGCKGGYGKQLRQRANDVEAAQRKQEEDRLERGMATLERAQRKAWQAGHSRSASCDV